MLNRTSQRVFLTLYLYLMCILLSQSNHLYHHSNPSTIEIGNPIQISQLMFSQEPIQSGMLYFRETGKLSFQEIKMSYENGRWTGIIPAHRVTISGIEYLTILQTYDGGRIAMPLIDDPFNKPLFIKVISTKTVGIQKKSINKNNNYTNADILVLSPETGSVMLPDEVVISASLFNAPSVDQSKFQLLVNNKDYTDQTVIFDDVLSLVPSEELEFGFYKIKLLFKTKYGMDVEPVEWTFSISKGVKNFSESFKYNGSFLGKKSQSNASSISIDDQEYSSKLNAEISWIKIRYSSRASSRESKFLQPINRSSFIIQITDYLKIENGDVYPSISPFLLDGKRVNGRHIDAGFDYKIGFNGFRIFGKDLLGFELTGGFELQTVSGELIRAVQYQNGIDRAYELLTDYAKYDASGNRIYLFNRKGYTFPRKINAYRFGLSFNNNFKAGIHLLKAKDDFDKINLYASENSTFSVDSSITGDTVTTYYTLARFIDSVANGNSNLIKVKNKNWANGNPQENLALGFEVEGALDNRKLLFQLGWNMSLTNYNIWAGRANKDSLDLLMDTIPDGKLLGDYPVSDIGKFIDDYSDVFTVNPLYMTPILPIDPIIAQESTLRAILNMPASAYFFRVKGSYMFNNILVEYRQLGSQYKSFGNPFLTNNIREFFINDRLSLLGRRLMFVAGYKYRDNKLSELVTNPVATKTVSLNTTLVPGPGAPSIIMNIQSIGKTNGIDSIDVDQYGNYLGDNREDSQALNLMASINLPGNFENFTTTSSINVNSISYTDNLASNRKKDFFFQKAETQSLAATLSTRFVFPLKTTSTFNQTKIFIPYLDQNNIAQKQTNTWTSYMMSAQYAFLENRLRLRSGIDYTTNGKKDDTAIKLYGGKLGCDWDIFDKLTLTFNSSIRLNNNKNNNFDEIDNDGDGKTDEKRENWSMNSSGVNLTLGYKF